VPPTAGYSGTPLAKKLGIAPGLRVLLLGQVPAAFPDWVAPLPDGATLARRGRPPHRAVHVFVSRRKDLVTHLARLRETLHPDGFLWVSWPKKSSGVATDVTEDVIRAEALPLAFVDIKVCAVSEVWSGLKLVIRKQARRGT